MEDTHLGNPYDLKGTRGDEVLYVEVKGTTGAGHEVIVTRGEVKHARAHVGQCTLIVVSRIEVTEVPGEPPVADGGDVHRVVDWQPEEERLEPLTYAYELRPRP